MREAVALDGKYCSHIKHFSSHTLRPFIKSTLNVRTTLHGSPNYDFTYCVQHLSKRNIWISTHDRVFR